MKFLAKCKFCGKALTIDLSGQGFTDEEILAGYEWTSALAPLVCCNHCGDLRVQQRRVVEPIVRLAFNASLLQQSPKDWQDAAEETRQNMARLVRQFVAVGSKWLKKPEIQIEDGMVQDILDKPAEVRRILGFIWRTIKSQPDPAPELPI